MYLVFREAGEPDPGERAMRQHYGGADENPISEAKASTSCHDVGRGGKKSARAMRRCIEKEKR